MKIKDFHNKTGKPVSFRKPKIKTKTPKVKPCAKNIDPAYESSDGVCDILSLMRANAEVILVSGRAGTGKTKFIKYLASIPGGDKQIVVAPTGIAALNVEATTIHSTFALPFGAIDALNMKEKRLGKELLKIERLIIDEISMVRADVLDAIDMRLRKARFSNKPFGGVQVIMIGDFLQLPPVVRDDDEHILRELGYETPFAFSAKVLEDMNLKVATLKKVWRQSDPEFISKLGMIRDGRTPQDPVDWINKKCCREPRAGSKPMMLTPTRAAAENYNLKGIEERRIALRKELGLPADAAGEQIGEHLFKGVCEGSFTTSKQLPVPEEQLLAPGVRVMAVRNDQQGRYVNGSLGTVESIKTTKFGSEDAETVKVLFDGAKAPVNVEVAEWEEVKHKWNDSTSSIDKDTSGTYRQIPLVLGYATTIHKCQGLTLEDVRIDLGRGAFAPGQLYVALSRAKSAEGLSLQRPITVRDVRTDKMLTSFLNWAQGNSNLSFSATN